MNCCICGISTSTPLCIRCISLDRKIGDGIKQNEVLEHCRGCDRYLCPPKRWISCEWLSVDLLNILLKRKKDIIGYNIVSSTFLRSEIHSKRFILKIEIEKEHLYDTILIKYVVRNKQCPDCEKREAKQYWNCVVQLRQKSDAKRTFMYVEQAIINNKMYNSTSNIKERKDGIDFYYLNKIEAQKMVKFIEGVVGTTIITSAQIISEDRKSNTAKNKHTFSLEIYPLNKDDLLLISEKLSKIKNIGRVLLVTKVTTRITMVDPTSGKKIELNKRDYYAHKDEIEILLSSKNLAKYKITEIEENGEHSDIYLTKDYNRIYHSKTHLKNIYEDDEVLCYDIEGYKLLDFEFFSVLPVRRIIKNEQEFRLKAKRINGIEHRYFLEDLYADDELRNGINVYDRNNDVLMDFKDLQLK